VTRTVLIHHTQEDVHEPAPPDPRSSDSLVQQRLVDAGKPVPVREVRGGLAALAKRG